MKKILLAVFIVPLYAEAQNGWTEIMNFGANPGALKMFRYVPVNMQTNAPLVMVLHGCTQTASGYDTDSDWQKLAEKHKFYVVYAEQVPANGANNCFNYCDPADISKDQGETASIKQMVDKMKVDFSIDNKRVFVTGFSAGGIMTASQLASYPDVYKAGAFMAGLPFKAMASCVDVLNAVQGKIIKTPQQWGDIVRNENPLYTGPYPKVAIFHGTKDGNVNFQNAIELMKQWTNVSGIDTLADTVISAYDGNTSVKKIEYRNTNGDVVVVRYDFIDMVHGISINPGSGLNCREGGNAGTYAIDINHFSTYWVAHFFGLIPGDNYKISGPVSVTQNQTGVIYTVPNTAGSTYTWNVPTGASVISGQGTSQVNVNWGTVSGNVSVSESDNASCGYKKDLWVDVNTSTGVVVIWPPSVSVKVYPNPFSNETGIYYDEGPSNPFHSYCMISWARK